MIHRKIYQQIFMALCMCLFQISWSQGQDPWEGSYDVDVDGTSTGTTLDISKAADYYLLHLNNNQTYKASQIPSGLYGKDELGQEFYLKKMGGKTVMIIASLTFNLSRKTANEPTVSTVKKEDQTNPTVSSGDPFEGLYTVRFMGEDSEKKIRIRKKSEESYTVDLDGESLVGARKGNTLDVRDQQGNSMNISFDGNYYKMRVMDLMDFDMVRLADVPKGKQSNGAPSKIDPDLVGSWIRSTSYSSGSGEFSFSIATVTEYQFFEDGRYRYSSRSAGGTSDVGADSGAKQTTGAYSTEEVKSRGEKYLLIDGSRIPYHITEDRNVLILNERSNIFKRQ